MTLPNFLIIGTMKAGTTSLYYYLKQHPQVFMSPVKAPDFFALEGRELDFSGPEGPWINRWIRENKATTIDEYRALFRGVSTETAVGEATPIYLYRPEALARIKHHVPDARLIIVLRDPAERAHSAFLHCVRDGREPLTEFADALEAEEERIRANWEYIWHYRTMGFYAGQLKRCFDAFERDQVRVYLYEDLRRDPAGVVRDILRYLGVDDAVTPDTSRRHNVAAVPRRGVIRWLTSGSNPIKSAAKTVFPQELGREMKRRMQRFASIEPPPLREGVRRELVDGYREDVEEVQALLGRDLSAWRT